MEKKKPENNQPTHLDREEDCLQTFLMADGTIRGASVVRADQFPRRLSYMTEAAAAIAVAARVSGNQRLIEFEVARGIIRATHASHDLVSVVGGTCEYLVFLFALGLAEE